MVGAPCERAGLRGAMMRTSECSSEVEESKGSRGRRVAGAEGPTLAACPAALCCAVLCCVQPGFSFHSIQEVFTPDKPRMSIQVRGPGRSSRGTLCMLCSARRSAWRSARWPARCALRAAGARSAGAAAGLAVGRAGHSAGSGGGSQAQRAPSERQLQPRPPLPAESPTAQLPNPLPDYSVRICCHPAPSRQGWFHSDAPPENAAMATLRQLQMKPGEDAVAAFDAFTGGWKSIRRAPGLDDSFDENFDESFDESFDGKLR